VELGANQVYCATRPSQCESGCEMPRTRASGMILMLLIQSIQSNDHNLDSVVAS
jgi:hypothetical protein